MSLSSSHRVCWTGELPILQTVHPETAVKWVSILAIPCPKVAVAPVVSSLIGSQVGDYHHRLGQGRGGEGQKLARYSFGCEFVLDTQKLECNVLCYA